MGCCPPCPILTLRKMAGLSVAGFHLGRLGRLQVHTTTRRPDGTNDLPSPNAGTTAFRALKAQGRSGKRERERDAEAKDSPREGGDHTLHRHLQNQDQTRKAGIGKGQALTRLHELTCQAWSRNTGQASCTQGSVRVGWSLKEHAAAWTRDPSSPWQVTLLFLMPVPHVTEHCKQRCPPVMESQVSWDS